MKTFYKEEIYLSLWVFTGILFGFLIAALVALLLIELKISFPDDLMDYIFIILCSGGAIFGAFIGPVAWKKIYVEGARGKKYLVKKEKL